MTTKNDQTQAPFQPRHIITINAKAGTFKRRHFHGFLLSFVSLVMCSPALAEQNFLVIETTTGFVEIDLETLALRGAPKGFDFEPIAAAAFDAGTMEVSPVPEVPDGNGAWTVCRDLACYTVRATEDRDAVVIRVEMTGVVELNWPVGAAPELVAAYALPVFGEGKFVPADDPEWLSFFVEHADRHHMEALSLPIWTEIRADWSLTWIVDPPYNTDLLLSDADGRLQVGMVHEPSTLAPDAAYEVRLVFGDTNPVSGAQAFRSHLQDTGRFSSLTEKAVINPDTNRLAGAPHIYLWERGPLKVSDVSAWRRIVRRFDARRGEPDALSARMWDVFDPETRNNLVAAFAEAQGEDGYVSAFSRTTFIRAVNAALPEVIDLLPHTPLPGGHDPLAQDAWLTTARAGLLREFPDSLNAPETWGGGVSTGIIDALVGAGIEQAWIGAEGWLNILWHPEGAAAAHDAGYLLTTYDSYGSAHPTGLEDTWPTAQMGDDIYRGAAFMDADGDRVIGFAGRGVYANPALIEDYAFDRISTIAEAAQLDTYFLDVDATGDNDADYSTANPTSREQVDDALIRRIRHPFDTLNLVTGSEGGVYRFAEHLHYAHGMTTVPFKWTNPDMKDNTSEFFVGGYWPPEAPAIFFDAVPLPDAQKRLFFDPRFRLPLYQIALHDSIVTTHHWEYPSTKFIDEQARTELLQMLYMVPPLYHLSAQTLDRDLPGIERYIAKFAPLHEVLFNQQMMSFAFKSDDRLVQETVFGDGTRLTANFADAPRDVGRENMTLPSLSLLVERPDMAAQTLIFGGY